MNKTVVVNMVDMFTGKEIQREMDISVLFINGATCWELPESVTVQGEKLEEWIEERGNDQHDTTLELVSWEIINHV